MGGLGGRFYDGVCRLHGATDEVNRPNLRKAGGIVSFGFPASLVLSFTCLVLYSTLVQAATTRRRFAPRYTMCNSRWVSIHRSHWWPMCAGTAWWCTARVSMSVSRTPP